MVETTSWLTLQKQYATLLSIAEENNNKSLLQVSSLEEIIAKQRNEQEAMQQSVVELKKQLEAKGVELEKVVGERDAHAMERGEAQQAVEELKKQLKQVSASLTEKEMEAKDASEEAELTLLQLHQVQEELEHYFRSSRAKEELVQKHQAQQQRMKELMSKALITFSNRSN